MGTGGFFWRGGPKILRATLNPFSSSFRGRFLGRFRFHGQFRIENAVFMGIFRENSETPFAIETSEIRTPQVGALKKRWWIMNCTNAPFANMPHAYEICFRISNCASEIIPMSLSNCFFTDVPYKYKKNFRISNLCCKCDPLPPYICSITHTAMAIYPVYERFNIWAEPRLVFMQFFLGGMRRVAKSKMHFRSNNRGVISNNRRSFLKKETL